MLKDQLQSDILTSTTSFPFRNQDSATLQEIKKLESNYDTERRKYFSKLHEVISQIQAKLVSLKAEVHNDYTMEIRDADYYRVTMFQLEGQITELKQALTIE